MLCAPGLGGVLERDCVQLLPTSAWIQHVRTVQQCCWTQWLYCVAIVMFRNVSLLTYNFNEVGLAWKLDDIAFVL